MLKSPVNKYAFTSASRFLIVSAICTVGNFMDHVPNAAAQNVIKQMIQCGLELGHIQSSYTLKGMEQGWAQNTAKPVI
jgi:hypothetical protein